MKQLKLGQLNVRAVGEGTAGAILMCHGFGAPGDDLVPLAEAMDPGLRWRWFFAEAPLDLRGQGIPGRAWWNIDIMKLQLAVMAGKGAELVRETPQGLPEARAALESAIVALETEHAVQREKLVIGGFSQGAMLTTDVALHAEKSFAGLCVLSGALIAQEHWSREAKRLGSALHVFQSHGRADPILPFEGAELLRELLVGAGANVSWVAHRGGHEIPLDALRGMTSFLKTRLG